MLLISPIWHDRSEVVDENAVSNRGYAWSYRVRIKLADAQRVQELLWRAVDEKSTTDVHAAGVISDLAKLWDEICEKLITMGQ